MTRSMHRSAESADSAESAVLPASAGHWTVGDRLCAVRVLLPAELGHTLLALEPDLARAWFAMLPDSCVVGAGSSPTGANASLDPRVAVRGLPEDALFATVVVDERTFDLDSVRRALQPHGCLAVLGREGPHVLYPSSERPETIWRRGWRTPAGHDPVKWMRRLVGLRTRRSAPRLRLDGPSRQSLAEEVVHDVRRATGRSQRLDGILTAGQTILRLRGAQGDTAVRLRLMAQDRLPDLGETVAAEVPGLTEHLPTVLARGSTAGHPWTATEWVGRRSEWWRGGAERRAWDQAEATVALLASHQTGLTSPGWAHSWAQSADQFPTELRTQWAALMSVLDDAVPTAWCHGDLWRGNLLVDARRSVVLDWDNASRDAPAGLDRLLIPALRDAADPHSDVTSDLLDLVDEPDLLAGAVVAGRPWCDWDRPHRLALTVAAVVLYLRNRSYLDIDQAQIEGHRARLASLIRGEEHPGAVSDPSRSEAGSDQAGRTVRGALWLATNSIVVKASQTLVLLILAAILAPAALGLIALGTLIANASAVLASLGTASALVYWRGEVMRAARTAVTLALGSGIFIGVVVWAAAPWAADVLGVSTDGTAVIRGLILTLPLLAIASVTNELLRRRLEFLRRIVPDSVSAVIGAVVAVALAATGHGVMSLVYGQIVQGVLTLILSWCVHPPVRPAWNRDDARGLLSYGGPLAGANLLQLIQLNVDYIIVSIVLGAAALGQYSLAFRLAFMPYLMIAVVITGAAFPYLCGLRRSQVATASVAVMSTTLTIITPVCVGLLVLADHLTLLGDKWSPGVPVVAFLAGYAWLLSVGTLAQTVLNACGLTAISAALRLFHLLLLLIVLLLVVHRGIVAVAVSQMAAAGVTAVMAVALLHVFVQGFSLRALAGSLRALVIGGGVMGIAMALVRLLLRGSGVSVTTLVVSTLVGLLVYAASVWTLERAQLSELSRLVRGRP